LSGSIKYSYILFVVIALAVAIGGYFVWQSFQPPPSPGTPPGPGGGGQPPPPKQITLVVISRHGLDILGKVETAFLSSPVARKYNITAIQWLTPAAHLWVSTINARGDIDVAWGGGPVLFDTLYSEGLLKPLSGSVLNVVNKLPDTISGSPAKRFDSKGNIVWVGAAISSFGFTINKDYLKTYNLPEPDEWIDLANETYGLTLPRTSVGVANAVTSTSNTRMYEIIIQRYGWVDGWKIITLIGANAEIYDQSEAVRESVISKRIGVGLTIDFYGYTAQIQAPGVAYYVLPKDGTIVNADPIALLKTSKNVEAAQAFIEWVLSPEGQKIWLDPNVNRMPINVEVFNTPEGKSRQDLYLQYNLTLKAATIEFSDELASSYEQALIWFFDSTIVKPQAELRSAWIKLIQAKVNNKISQEKFKELVDILANPTKLTFIDPLTNKPTTFTMEYAQKINSYMNDVDFRTNICSIWRNAAIARYQQVASAVGG
jgi:ABC-type Fe3+ transport system substrate-binding protein